MTKKIEKITAVEFAAPGLLRIFAAMGYDTLLLAALSIGYSAVVVGLRVLIVGAPEAGQRIHWGLISGSLVTLGWVAIIMGFFIYFWHKFGQTLGMKTWRIQMVDEKTNQFASYHQCVKRSAVAFLSLLVFGFGYWYKFTNPKQRLLQDVLSDTKLVLLKKAS